MAIGENSTPRRTLAILEQMGNIGSEVERAIRAHDAGRQDRFEHALERALELAARR
jgi:hypothetical protein